MSKPTTADLNKRITELEAELATAQGTIKTLSETPAVPEGYVLLPVVPDEEIMLAGSDDQDSPWDAETPGRQIRRRILAAVTEVLLKRQ